MAGPTGEWEYDYDPIGNRNTFDENVNGTATDGVYTTNELNQYSRANVASGSHAANRLLYDADGNLWRTLIMADMNCDGSVNGQDIDDFVDVLNTNDTHCETHTPAECCWNGDMDGNGSVNGQDIAAFYGAIGGSGPAPDTVGVLHRRYTWDGENRLVKDEPDLGVGQSPQNGDKKLEFTYDYLNRRIEKKVWTASSGSLGSPTLDVKYVYDGWNVIEELNALSSNAVVRKYTWGLDLAGQNGASVGGPGFNPTNQGAAGIGGLLSVVSAAGPTSYYYTFDANGNVGQVVAASNGALAAWCHRAG